MARFTRERAHVDTLFPCSSTTRKVLAHMEPARFDARSPDREQSGQCPSLECVVPLQSGAGWSGRGSAALSLIRRRDALDSAANCASAHFFSSSEGRSRIGS
ncbi:hypothetical protein ILYODFUR_029091 [Ilyodon furcidens]|uniref:Uncharacterized protein n=1 Tax=Ilyodon furcidens TaxID=33524 RepID=A0ABV0VJN9_9TELE